jgi:hypothetical protein
MTGIGVDPGSGPYAYFCGTSHAELWRIQERHREAPAADGAPYLVPHALRALIHAALSASVDAVIHPVERVLYLLGRTAGTAELAHTAAQVRTALTL